MASEPVSVVVVFRVEVLLVVVVFGGVVVVAAVVVVSALVVVEVEFTESLWYGVICRLGSC